MKYPLYLFSIITLTIYGSDHSINDTSAHSQREQAELFREDNEPATPGTPITLGQIPFPNLIHLNQPTTPTSPQLHPDLEQIAPLAQSPTPDNRIRRLHPTPPSAPHRNRAYRRTNTQRNVARRLDFNERTETGEGNPFKGLLSTTKELNATCQKIIYLNEEKGKMVSPAYSLR